LNKKESEVLTLQEKLDLLEATVNELQGEKLQVVSGKIATQPALRIPQMKK
jgi:hypothetical protein